MGQVTLLRALGTHAMVGSAPTKCLGKTQLERGKRVSRVQWDPRMGPTLSSSAMPMSARQGCNHNTEKTRISKHGNKLEKC